MTAKTRNSLIVILVLAIPVVIFIGSIFYNAAKEPPLPPLPADNGYDDLMKSAQMLAPNVGTYNSSNLDELQAVVAADAGALQMARAGLQKQCQVPLDYNPTNDIMPRLEGIKFLGCGFAAEGDLEKIEGHPDQAAKSYLDIIHLANESSRGGAFIHELVGIAVEHIGTDALQKLLPQLDAETCRQTAATLETYDAQRQPWGEVLADEHAWSRRAYPIVHYDMVTMMQSSELKKIDQKAERRFEEQQARTRKLIIDLAARAYKLDEGHSPASVTDLVTNYLSAIPIDPATGTSMVYLP